MPAKKRTPHDLLKVYFWLGELMNQLKVDNVKDIQDKLSNIAPDSSFANKESTSWAKYKPWQAHAEIKKRCVPNEVLVKDIQKYFPGTEDILKKGPKDLFLLMEADCVNKALYIINQNIDELNNEFNASIRFNCPQSNKCSGLPSLITAIFDESAKQDNFDYVPLVFGISYILAKFASQTESMEDIIVDSLSYFRAEHRIPIHCWAGDLVVKQVLKKIDFEMSLFYKHNNSTYTGLFDNSSNLLGDN